MDTYDFPSSRALFERAGQVIPGGIYGHYGLAMLTPETPLYFSKAEGSHFVDIEKTLEIANDAFQSMKQ